MDNRFVNAKEDKRLKRGGWAPGNYYGTCFKCKDEFVGDKRALICADCAYSEEHEKEFSDRYIRRRIDTALDLIKRANQILDDVYSEITKKQPRQHSACGTKGCKHCDR